MDTEHKESARPKPEAVPAGWGEDELTKYVDNVRRNQRATFVRKKPAAQKLIAIEAQFRKVSAGWLNPQNEIAANLLIRCHSLFLAASTGAMGGQAAEVYPQARVMLEYAAYALHIHRNPELGVIWLNRHQDPVSMEEQKKAFSFNKVATSVAAADRAGGDRYQFLYQRTIDLGGHPNERSVTGNLRVVDDSDGETRTFLNVLLHDDGVALDLALKTVAQCGVTALEILETVFRARFMLLGVNAALTDLKRGL
jgi:hypothetical protein